MAFEPSVKYLSGRGGAVLAVDQVMTGRAERAVLAARPPGSHAEPNKPMGFCLFYSAAITAKHARAEHGLTRVAVLAFDLHHGIGDGCGQHPQRADVPR